MIRGGVMDGLEQLAKEFKQLIKERDQLPYHEHENNPRCIEIDEVEIPRIINQIPKGRTNRFNQLIND
jgi:hypothetical protein